MKKTILYCIWAFFYLLCGFISNIRITTDAQSAALTILSLIFFIPGGILLVDALRGGDKKTLKILRWISGLSLGLTLVTIIANIASVNATEAVGNVLHQVLIFVSVPMVCSQHYVLSLFLWACLLFATLPQQKKK